MTNKKNRKKTKRIILLTLICIGINGYIVFSVGSILKDVRDMKREKQDLALKLDELKEQTETLKVEANKLQDKDYVCKYAREKFLYSGEGEYILKIK